MLENINDLRIQGGCYVDPTDLNDIFAQRFNVVYGRNGSGKSSIAEAINEWANSDPNVSTSSRFDLGDSLPNELKDHVYVFNQQFIDKNVSIKDDGLQSIVSVGGQVSYDKAITQLDIEIAGLEAEIGKKNDDLEKQKTFFSTAEGQIKKTLRDEKGDYRKWGNIANSATGAKQIPQNIDAIRSAGQGLTAKDRQSLVKEIDEKIAILNSIKSGETVNWTKPYLKCGFGFARSVNEKLHLAIKKPELDEAQQHVFDIVLKRNYINAVHDVFDDDGVDVCPLCQRPISGEEKQRLFEAVAIMRDETSTKFIEFLNEMRTAADEVEFKFPSNDVFFKDCLKECRIAVGELNTQLGIIRHNLKDKINTLYEPLPPIDANAFENAWKAFDSACEALAVKVREQNLAVQEKTQLGSEIWELNRKIAFIDNSKHFQTMETASDHMAQIQQEIAEKVVEKTSKETQKQTFVAEASQVEVALEFINGCLAYVFLDNDRMKLVCDDNNVYKLLVHGKDVIPKNVSTGEKNIIALAYFFASMLHDKSLTTMHMNEKLVVIDDPVSSFDEGNRSGILSLMDVRLEEILRANNNSKVLVLTHDIRTVNDLVYNFNNMKYRLGINNDDCLTDIKYLELVDKQLVPQNKVVSSTYKMLLEKVIAFALGSDEDGMDNDSIGNTIRRFVEMYKAFRYNGDNFTIVLTDKKVIGDFPDSLKNYFMHSNTMLILNSYSHGNLINPANLYTPSFDTKELRQLAQNLLAFILLTDHTHLAFILKKQRDTIAKIENLAYELSEVNFNKVVLLDRGNCFDVNKAYFLEFDEKILKWHCGDFVILDNGHKLHPGMPIRILTGKDNRCKSDGYPYFSNKWEFAELEDVINSNQA